VVLCCTRAAGVTAGGAKGPSPYDSPYVRKGLFHAPLFFSAAVGVFDEELGT
jgi:hypothetical protein